MSFVPKFKPYITPTISAEYDIKDVGTVGAKASLDGASVTFSRRIK